MSWLCSYEVHFILEAVALMVALYLGCLGFGLMKLTRGRIECRALFGFGLATSLVKVLHLLLPSIESESEWGFIPTSWLLEDLVVLPVLYLVAAKWLTARAAFAIAASGVAIGALVWLSSHSSYYEGLGPIGRPEEFLVVLPSLFLVGVLLRTRQGLKERDASGVFVIATLLLMAATSLTMAFSKCLFDAACLVAHFLQLAAYAPMCALARKLTN